MKFKIEKLNERRESVKKAYRDFSQLEGDTIITEDNIDDWALRKTCSRYKCSEANLKHDLLETLLVEDTLEDVASKATSDIDDLNVVDANDRSQIENELDRALDYNQEQNDLGSKNFQNVLLVGGAGTGKTSIVRRWAQENNVNLFEVRAAGMDDTDLGGVISKSEDNKTAVRLASTEFDDLNKPNSVLFLDEYNRAPQSVRTNLLELINSHVVPDPRQPNKQRYLENLLFTIAAINPPRAGYTGTDKLDTAEVTRFKQVDVVAEPLNLLKHLTGVYTTQAEKASTPERKKRALNRINLAKALLTSKEFEFDTVEDEEKSEDNAGWNGLTLNYRTLTNAISGSDGTKEDFLKNFRTYCNNLRFNMVKSILNNYEDVENKANSVFKNKTKSNLDKIWDVVSKEEE